MKANRKFIKGEGEAVSAVIGVILMVAITVAIAATVYVYVGGMTGGIATKTSKLFMNLYSQDDVTNTRIWLVSGIEGEAILNTSYNAVLLNASGEVDAATITFNEVTDAGYINAGDTFTVVASGDGYFTFMLSDPATGATIYTSSSG